MTMFITCKSEYFNLKKRSTSMQFLKYTKVDRSSFQNIYTCSYLCVKIAWKKGYKGGT